VVHRTSIAGVLLALGVASTGCREAEARELPPSVILISLDTVRADHLGLYGYERDTSPRLDALAEESSVWEDCYTTAAWTLIAHMSMLTGLYPTQHGVVAQDARLSPDVPLLAERLAARGYDTIGLYFEGWIHARHGFDRGFRVFEAHEDAAEAGEHLRARMAERDPSRPLFLFVHLFDAHTVDTRHDEALLYDPPPPFDRVFVADAPDRFGAGDARKLFIGRRPVDADELEGLTGLYDGALAYLDSVVGALVDDWRADGLLDRSILVVTSDHGEALGQRDGELGGHGDMWREGLHVPLVVRLPRGELGGRRIAGLVSSVDIVPTLLGRLGIEREPWIAGYDLFEGRPTNTLVAAERPPQITLLQGSWKLDTHAENVSGQAYDLERDPLELAPYRLRGPDERQQRFREIRQDMLAAWQRELGARPGLEAPPLSVEAFSDEEKSELQALGYVVGE
jgi:arylsulfatase A-like enzyme